MDGVATWDGPNTGANYSGSIWGDCPVEALRNKNQNGPQGFLWEKIFGPIPLQGTITTEIAWGGDMAAFGSATGTIVDDTTEIGGGAKLGATEDNEGVGLRMAAAPFKIILTGGPLWFEARVLTSTIADTKHGIFLGLRENVALSATSPIKADGTLADINLVGFHRLEGDGDYFDCVYKANGVTAVTVQADAAPLVAGTYTNLGMKFNPSKATGKGAGYLYFYQDGEVIGSKLIPTAAGTDFPNDINLGFVFSILNATDTAEGTSTIKHARVAQLIG